MEIPLAAQHALFLHTWPGRWGSAGNSAALPKDGYRGPFKPFVWLGDHQRGFCWFAESDRNFFNPKPDRVLEIERAGDRVVLRVHLVTAPQTIDGPLEYTFGFQATPVKPAQPDAWDYRIVHMGGYGLDNGDPRSAGGCGVRTMCFHEHWTDIQNYPKTTHGAELDKLVAACHQRKIQLLLYFGYEMSNIAPEWDRYHEECLVHPRAGGYKRKPEQTAYIVCYRSHWQDFLAEGIDRVMAEHGVDGVYLDGTSEPWGCANTRHGCGYKRPDGSVGTTYTFFATRQMMKRIYTIVKHRNPAGQVNVHQSTCMTIPTLAFATSYWDGEQLQGLKRQVLALGGAAAGRLLRGVHGPQLGRAGGVAVVCAAGRSAASRRCRWACCTTCPCGPAAWRTSRWPADCGRPSTPSAATRPHGCPIGPTRRSCAAEPAGVKVSLYNRPGKGLMAVIVNTGGRALPGRGDLRPGRAAAARRPGRPRRAGGQAAALRRRPAATAARAAGACGGVAQDQASMTAAVE